MLVLLFRGSLRQTLKLISNSSRFGILALSAMLIGLNWMIYVYAANHREVQQASLGYFTCPILTAVLGVLVLHEQLYPLEWIAVSTGLVAVLVIAIGDSHMPWIALGLAFSFSLYGLAKNYVVRHVTPMSSLGIELLLLAPLSIISLGWLASYGNTHFTSYGTRSMLWMASTGVITVAPLTFFAAAVHRLPLSTVDMMQYLSPTLQFIIAVAVNHEPMPLNHWIGFGIIWFALVVLTRHTLLHHRRISNMDTVSTVPIQGSMPEFGEPP